MDTMQAARPATANPTSAIRVGASVTTGLFAVLIAISGVLYLVGLRAIVAAIHNLGYPDYFRQMLGVAKLLGAAALIAPRMPTLREWAYAGLDPTLRSADADAVDLVELVRRSEFLEPAHGAWESTLDSSDTRQRGWRLTGA